MNLVYNQAQYDIVASRQYDSLGGEYVRFKVCQRKS